MPGQTNYRGETSLRGACMTHPKWGGRAGRYGVLAVAVVNAQSLKPTVGLADRRVEVVVDRDLKVKDRRDGVLQRVK